jgi:hypothetical protein
MPTYFEHVSPCIFYIRVNPLTRRTLVTMIAVIVAWEESRS